MEKEMWRFNTIPAPGEPGSETWKGDAWKTGGGSIWATGAYDPELNLVYWGVGNPGRIGTRWTPGDNLYTDSVVALDPDTGKLKWHYQFTPHDEFDFDSTQDAGAGGHPVSGQPSQGDDVGKPKRSVVRARSHQWTIPFRQAIHPSELGGWIRRERTAE
jgi:alcohol dehydrogenase (cytochrome c)